MNKIDRYVIKNQNGCYYKFRYNEKRQAWVKNIAGATVMTLNTANATIRQLKSKNSPYAYNLYLVNIGVTDSGWQAKLNNKN